MSEHTNPGGRYPHVVRAVLETPWALEPAVLAAIREVVALRASGGGLTDEEIQARIGKGPARRGQQRVGHVAVLPLYGVITPRADLFTEVSGGTSVSRFRSEFLDAVDDRDVSAIVLDVASPGGMTDLVPELAADIRGARGRKPIVAVANTKATSAAYWLASQADEVVASPSSVLGSIGVYAAHDDLSAAQEKLGVKTTLVSAGKFKTEGNPYEPLSDEARASIQERVDEMYGMFTADVAKGRRVPVEEVRGGFGEGRVLTAKQAVKAGLADSVGSLQQTVDRLGAAPRETADAPVAITFSGTSWSTSDVSAAVLTKINNSFVDEAKVVRDAALDLVERTTSLAEVERGHLTGAKRESLTACTEALRESTAALEQVLADTDPHRNRNLLAAEYARAVRAGHL